MDLPPVDGVLHDLDCHRIKSPLLTGLYPVQIENMSRNTSWWVPWLRAKRIYAETAIWRAGAGAGGGAGGTARHWPALRPGASFTPADPDATRFSRKLHAVEKLTEIGASVHFLFADYGNLLLVLHCWYDGDTAKSTFALFRKSVLMLENYSQFRNLQDNLASSR